MSEVCISTVLLRFDDDRYYSILWYWCHSIWVHSHLRKSRIVDKPNVLSQTAAWTVINHSTWQQDVHY